MPFPPRTRLLRTRHSAWRMISPCSPTPSSTTSIPVRIPITTHRPQNRTRPKRINARTISRRRTRSSETLDSTSCQVSRIISSNIPSESFFSPLPSRIPVLLCLFLPFFPPFSTRTLVSRVPVSAAHRSSLDIQPTPEITAASYHRWKRGPQLYPSVDSPMLQRGALIGKGRARPGMQSCMDSRWE